MDLRGRIGGRMGRLGGLEDSATPCFGMYVGM